MKRAARSVTLLIPGLFGPRLGGERVWEGMTLPVLEQWLTRAAHGEVQGAGLERSLFALFGVAVPAPRDVPVAAVTRQRDRHDAGEGYWLRADPVYLRADRDRLVVLGNTLLDVSAEEQALLARELAPLFEQDGLTLDAVNARRWYLRTAEAPQLETTPLPDAIGQDAFHCMPQGPNARRWRSLLNEVQMTLHASEVNARRVAAGQLPVNSVWFWGGGVLPSPPSHTWSQVWSNEAVAAGLAALADVPHSTLPADACELLEDDAAGAHLVVLDGVRESVQMGNVEAWQAFLQSVYEAWLAPLYEAVKSRQLDYATLHPAERSTFRIGTREARRWWLRRRPLKQWLLAQPHE